MNNLYNSIFKKIGDVADFTKHTQDQNKDGGIIVDSDGKERTILLVSDDDVTSNYLYNALASEYNVICSKTGVEASDTASSAVKIDMIICDIYELNDKDTEIFCEMLKSGKYKKIPIIFISSVKDDNKKNRLIGDGAIDFIYKPYNPIELLSKIKSLLNLLRNIKEEIKNSIKNNLDYLLTEDEYKNIPEQEETNYGAFGISIREKEIINLIKEGRENKEIAQKLNLACKTVERHIYNIYKKCKISNKIELFNLFRGD